MKTFRCDVTPSATLSIAASNTGNRVMLSLDQAYSPSNDVRLLPKDARRLAKAIKRLAKDIEEGRFK